MGTDIAKNGYRRLRGGCTDEMGSSTYQHHTNEYHREQLGVYKDPGAGNIKEIEGAGIESGNPGKDDGKSIPKGADGSTEAMSAKHHRDTIKYDLRHAVDHEKDAMRHKKALKKLTMGDGE
jgi:hypothetical protein